MDIKPAIQTLRIFMHCSQWHIFRSSLFSVQGHVGLNGRICASETIHQTQTVRYSSNINLAYRRLPCSSLLGCGVQGISVSQKTCLPYNTKLRSVTAGHNVSSVRLAGHSKWSNIRHIKAAKDSEKARVIAECSRKIRAFIRETGQTDPKMSSQLAKMIADAKAKNVPNASIDRVISQMISLKNTAPVMFEAKGPAGSMMLIEVLTMKTLQTRIELQSIVKKCGFSLFDTGSLARIAFEEKGVIQVSCPGDTKPDVDSYVDLAIESGAEDVTLTEDEEGGQVFEFVCDPEDVYAVKKKLEGHQLPIISAEVVFNAVSSVPLDPTNVELIAKVMDKLDEHPDVLKVYTNVLEQSSP